MFRSLLIISALVMAMAGSALAGGRALSPQQKSAATRAYKARAEKQFGEGVGVRVSYVGPTGRDANIVVLGVGGLTGTQPNSRIGVGRGRVVVHTKPSVIKKQGKTDV